MRGNHTLMFLSLSFSLPSLSLKINKIFKKKNVYKALVLIGIEMSVVSLEVLSSGDK